MLGHRINAVLFSSYNRLPWSITKDLEREYLTTLFGFDSLRFSNQVLLPLLLIISKIFLAICIIGTLLFIHFSVTIFSISIFGIIYGLIIYFIRKKLVQNSQDLTNYNEKRLISLDQTFSSRKLLTVREKTHLFENEFQEASKCHARALGKYRSQRSSTIYCGDTITSAHCCLYFGIN